MTQMVKRVGEHLPENIYSKIEYPYSRNDGKDFSIPTSDFMDEHDVPNDFKESIIALFGTEDV